MTPRRPSPSSLSPSPVSSAPSSPPRLPTSCGSSTSPPPPSLRVHPPSGLPRPLASRAVSAGSAASSAQNPPADALLRAAAGRAASGVWLPDVGRADSVVSAESAESAGARPPGTAAAAAAGLFLQQTPRAPRAQHPSTAAVGAARSGAAPAVGKVYDEEREAVTCVLSYRSQRRPSFGGGSASSGGTGGPGDRASTVDVFEEWEPGTCFSLGSHRRRPAASGSTPVSGGAAAGSTPAVWKGDEGEFFSLGAIPRGRLFALGSANGKSAPGVEATGAGGGVSGRKEIVVDRVRRLFGRRSRRPR